MQRPVNFNRNSDLENQQPEMNDTPRRRAIDEIRAEIPVTIARSVNGRRSVPRWYAKPEVLIHLIPVLIFVCFFILLWFSAPGVTDPNMEDEMVHKTYLMENPHDLETSRINLAMLAKAAPPEASLPGILTEINATNGQPVSGDHLLLGSFFFITV